ncbi:unnamed protein product [Ilex paraguariensis]|uniref:Flavin-containing monooxygenase n=1 Tax=Ilex paraguariensis TaxID=185542 RepID=A0ABC8RDS8_9AQUA
MFRLSDHNDFFSRRRVWVNGPVIVGAGPSGLAVGACLQEQGVPFVILERADCIASLWQKRTYDRLKLHLPSNSANYLNSHSLNTFLNTQQRNTKYDEACRLWRVKTVSSTGSTQTEVEYICQWLIVATGENADRVMPDIKGLQEFGGEVIHACDYKSGEKFHGKKVLVVGCGNSGMEVSLDLCNHDAKPSMVVRSSVHVLPREIFGKSTFELAMFMMKWLPLWLVDRMLLVLTWFILGNIENYGIKRPSVGPLELKNTQGKTPVLDIGALEKIRSGEINVVPGIKRLSSGMVELLNGKKLKIDSVVLATGYCSNVPYWLQETEFFSKNGFPKAPFPNGWKGKAGLYAVGFTKEGSLVHLQMP